MFLEINGIKKHYGEGESRVEVLNGIDIEVHTGYSYDYDYGFTGRRFTTS